MYFVETNISYILLLLYVHTYIDIFIWAYKYLILNNNKDNLAVQSL